jgi:hypothetical protein
VSPWREQGGVSERDEKNRKKEVKPQAIHRAL